MANTGLDTKLAVKIPALLEKLGKDATFHIPATKTINPRTGTVDEGTVTDYTWKVTPPVHTKMYVNNDILQGSIWRAFIAATDITFTPTEGYKMTLGSKVWQIHEITEIYSGNLVVGYKLFLKS